LPTESYQYQLDAESKQADLYQTLFYGPHSVILWDIYIYIYIYIKLHKHTDKHITIPDYL
jgi:hypothetical protein